MKSFLLLLGLVAIIPSLWAQDAQKLDKLRITRQSTDAGGCIYIDSTPDQYTTLWGNTCERPMQFTIEWSGRHPANKVTYHINARDVRVVARIDTSGNLTEEAPAAAASGDKISDIEVQKKDIGNGQTMLALVNSEMRPAFVNGTIAFTEAGKQVGECKVELLVKAEGQENACVMSGPETFVPHFEAWLDPN